MTEDVTVTNHTTASAVNVSEHYISVDKLYSL